MNNDTSTQEEGQGKILQFTPPARPLGTQRIPQSRYEWIWKVEELEVEKARFIELLKDTPRQNVKIIQRWRRQQIRLIEQRINYLRRIKPNI